MSYEKQVWSKYDALKPEDENIENGAVVTDSRMNHMENGISDSSSTVENHIANKLNPHSVTKNQVGLGNVQNFGLATEDEAKQGDSNAKYMTPSLTQAVLSANINSIAYANSSDGTDGFTTVYPNLNLLDGTNSNDKSWLLGGNGSYTSQYVPFNSGYKYTFTYTRASTDWGVYMFSGLQKDKFKPDTDYVLSFMANVTTNIKPEILFANAPAQHNFVNQLNNPTILSSNGDQKVVIQLRTSSNIPSESDQQLYIGGFGNKVGTFSIWDLKIEEGSTATPYMQSSSEVTTADWPKFVGFSNTVKTDKTASDYTWFPYLTNKVEDHVNNRSNPHGVTASQVGSYTKSEVATLISEAIKQSKLDANPIGTILTTISNTNPSTYIGGTWERFANGRTLVGVDETDDVTLMKTANKMGGSTNPITEHRHDFGKVGSQQTYTFAWGTGTYTTSQIYLNTGQFAAGAAPNNNLLTKQHADLGGTTNSGNNTDHNNWQPFVTVYFWRRTA